MIRYGSVCSGIEAATAAWHPLGWRAAFFSEIDAFPRAVLAHRLPEVPLHGDFTTIQAGDYEPIDLLVGGTPCQSFSIAGLRGGLGDDRGNLALEYLRLADRLRPRWLVWENVPGVLSSNGGRDFGAILGGMVQLGYGIAYRVLDAQYVRVERFERAVPQRRRRVFVVGHLGDWRRAAAVLFERESLCGNPAPSRNSRSGIAVGALMGTSPGGGWRLGADEAATGQLIVGTLQFNGKAAGSATQQDAESGLLLARCVTTGEQRRQDYESTTLIVHPLRGQAQPSHREDSDTYVTHSLCADGFDSSEDGTGRGTPLVPVAFAENSRSEIRLEGGDGARTGALSAGGGKPGQGIPMIAFNSREDCVSSGEVFGALGSSSPQSQAVASMRCGVRRLTPRECERLQGFDDDYTLVSYRGKPAADGPRYKALGNSMAVPCMAWIGRRIQRVESMSGLQERAA